MTRRLAVSTLAALAITALSGTDQPPRPPPSASGAVLIPPVEYTRTPFGVRADRGSPRSELIHVEPVSVPVEATTSTTAAPAPVRARAVRRPPVTAPRRLSPPTTVAAAVATSDGWGLPPLLRRIGGCESSGQPDGPLLWTTHNRYSTASGAFEFLDSTWNHYDGYARAMYAPPNIQVERAEADFAAHGTSPWAASAACWN